MLHNLLIFAAGFGAGGICVLGVVWLLLTAELLEVDERK